MPVPSKRNILIAVDESPFSSKIVDWSLQQALKAEDQILLVHVREPTVLMSGNIGLMVELDPTFRKIEDSNKDSSEAHLNELGKRFTANGYQVLTRSIIGDPREALLQEIIKEKPDMVIVGRHGKGHRLHMLMGSVSKYLVEHAQIPVTVIVDK